MNQSPRPSYAIAQPSRPARWPWALLIVVLLAIGAIGALIISGGDLTGGDDGPETIPGPNGEMIIVSQASASDPGGVATQDTAASSPVEAASVGDPAFSLSDGSALASVAPTIPASTSTPAGPTNIELAMDWAVKWQTGDFPAMYGLLSDAAKDSISQDDFVARYQAIYDRATITKVVVGVSPDPVAPDAAAVPFNAGYSSTALGDFDQDNTLPLVQQNGVWTVAWTPSAIFDGLANDGCVDLQSDPTERGRILDRNGEILAQDDFFNVIGVDTGAITDEAGLNQGLAGSLGMSEDEVAAAWANGEAGQFTPIRTLPQREVTPQMLGDLDLIDGVQVQPTSGRSYPFGTIAAHITGYVTVASEEDIAADPTIAAGSTIGRTGLEAGANDLLAGVSGLALSVVDCTSRSTRSTIAERAAVPGQDLILTIDIGLQKAVDKVLTDVEGTDERGSAVLIDPRNGAVLAMASHPTYDPNGFVLGFEDKAWERINDATLAPLLNRAADGLYPVGSVFKIITMAGGMAHLGYDENTVLECPSSYELNGNIYNDWVVEWGEQPQGQLTLHDALVQSCNTVFYDIGAKLDQQDDLFLPNMARSFGLGGPTNIPYLPEAGGVVPDPAWKAEVVGDGWSTGDAINLAIGQGFLEATPLQMANAYATMANGGTLLEPYMVEYTQIPGGPATRVGERKEISQLPLNSTQVGQIQQALRDQTSNAQERGSARVFGAAYPFAIAGKTGTSENPTERGSQPHSWFAAFGPWEDTSSVPTIASVVMLENKGEGGKFAAPATKSIYDYYLTTDLADQTDSRGSPPQAIEPDTPRQSPVSPPSTSPQPSTRGRRQKTTRIRASRSSRRTGCCPCTSPVVARS